MLEMKGISKAFSGVQVLNDVSLSVHGGEVLALLGENGAGKSTLMRILTGVYRADSGSIEIDGHKTTFRNISDAQLNGIEMIHQEMNLFANLSIAENFLMGHESDFRSLGLVKYKSLFDRTTEVMKILNLHHSPKTLVSRLSVAEQQLVEIGKILQGELRFLVMDEPTSALSNEETEKLFSIIQSLKAKGVGIIYISHRLEELFRIADKVTVLRDGKMIASREVRSTNERELVALMVGRDIEERYPKVESHPSDILLKADHISTDFVRDISLELRAGEIVGLGGLMGSGRTEVARALTGIDPIRHGQLILKRGTVRFRTPNEAIQAGIAFVTEDRKNEGLLQTFSVRENLALPTLKSRSRHGLVQSSLEKRFAQDSIKQLHVKTSHMEQLVINLSGGNQQKVVIAKWLACQPSVLIVDEPTRGVDVGAKQEIYHLMNELKTQGKAILMISSDLPELLAMSDRVYVMHEKKLQGELQGEQIDQEIFMRLATGGEMSATAV